MILSLITYVVVSLYGVSRTTVAGLEIAETALKDKPFISLQYSSESEKDDLVTIVKAIRSAQKMKEDQETGEPQYRITVKLNNNKTMEYDLWLGEKSGIIIYVPEPGSRYRLSEKAADDIKSVLGKYRAA